MIRAERTLVLLLLSNAAASVGIGVVMIAIPWFLASQTAGGALFGVIITVVNVALALFTPWIGILIDTTNRKVFMISLRLLFLAGLVIILIVETYSPGSLGALLIYYCLGAAFYAVNIPLRTASVQELYFGAAYARVNGILEIENQIAAIVTGAVAVLLIERAGLQVVVFLNILCLIGAVACLVMIDFQAIRRSVARRGPLNDILDGLGVMRQRPRLSILLLASTLPYIVVILYTYLHPVALAHLVGANGSDYAFVEVLFAIGAMAGGFILIRVTIPPTDLPRTIRLLVGLFAIVAIVQAILPTREAFFVIAIAFGLLNALIRVLRQTLLMNEVAAEEIGRIGAFLQSWIMFVRAVCLGLVTILVTSTGIASALLLAGLIALLGWLALNILGDLNDCTTAPQEREVGS